MFYLRLLLISVVALAGVQAGRAHTRLDSLLDVLDSRIENKTEYENIKRQRIAACKRRVQLSHTAESRFDNLAALFAEYTTFSMDSAILTARLCTEAAVAANVDSLRWKALFMTAQANRSFGEYDEALTALDNLPQPARRAYAPTLLSGYLDVYTSMAENTIIQPDAEHYRRQSIMYRDSLISILDSACVAHDINYVEMMRLTGRPRLGLAELERMLADHGTGCVSTGLYNHVRGQLLLALGRREEAKECLARAAIHDIEGAMRKYESLQDLAALLYEDGEIERAYNYLMCSFEDVQQAKARHRIFKITELLPIISEAYEDSLTRSGRTKTILISLAVLLLFTCLVIHMRVRKHRVALTRERALLHQKHNELKGLKEQLDVANTKLAQSGKRKEEYIGYLFNLCSSYIDAHERERSQLVRLFKTGNTAQAEKMLRSSQTPETLKSFYDEFDRIFLDIFPDFIERINALLQPDYQLQPREGERLSPELRIYALVRLGINDSTRIAAFLHYSAQTVYNYRFRVRSHAAVPKEEFADRVRNL